MRHHYKQCLLAFIITLFMMIVINDLSISAEHSALSESFDFSEQSYSKEFYTNLDGEWNFFEKELLIPSEVEEQLRNETAKVVTLPSSFKTQTGEVNTYGTYSTSIKIPKEYIGKTLAIHIPYQYSAYKLYINETVVAENGVVGQNTASHAAEMGPKTGYFIAQSDEILLTMQVSSFDHIRGGFENSIYIGESSVVSQKFNTTMISTLFMNGCIFIIGLFMVLFALYRRQEHLFFIFGMFSVLIAIRALFAVPFYYTLIFDMSWLWGTRLEYILTEATSMFYVILLWKWHEKEFSKKVMYGLVMIHITLMIITLFTQPVFFQTLFFNVFYLAIPTFFYMIYVICKSVRNHNRSAKVNLIGMGLIFLAFFNDFAIGQNWYQSIPLMLPVVGIYVLIHVILMSKNFSDSVRKTEQQNKQLLALNAANEELTIELQEEMKQKDDFLANTSHELRNPLHGIINIAQSILRNRPNQLDDKTKKDLALQLTIGHHMSRTLEDLLDITRLKEHRIRLEREHLDIQAISEGVVDMLQVLIENKNIQMEVRIPSDFPTVAADKNRLIQILFNLLHNAVKYTDEGIITIDADVQDEMVHIQITDPGIGMSEKTLHTIFEAYEQGDSSMTAMGGGLGLGLRICKQLVELHGGIIKADSSLGKGSVFTFTLPQEVAVTTPSMDRSELPFRETPIAINSMIKAFSKNAPPSYRNNMKRETPRSLRPKILAVDDDPVNLQVLTNILSEDHYEVEIVTSGKEALHQLERDRKST